MPKFFRKVCVKKFFKAKEVREKYPAVTLTSKQFKDFATRIDENIYAMRGSKVAKSSKGYKILSVMTRSPYEYAPTKQKAFDVESAKELSKKYSSEAIQKMLHLAVTKNLVIPKKEEDQFFYVKELKLSNGLLYDKILKEKEREQ